MNFKIQLSIIFILGFLTLINCSGPDPGPPLQTSISEVKVESNPVAVGDTAKFTCIIEDSLNENFKYHWDLDRTLENQTTEINSLQWVAPDDTGQYNHLVTVNNEDQNSTAPSKTFSITVVNN